MIVDVFGAHLWTGVRLPASPPKVTKITHISPQAANIFFNACGGTLMKKISCFGEI